MATSKTLKVQGRLCFPNIFEPHRESGKFNCLVSELDSKTVAKLKNESAVLMQEAWHGKITTPTQLKQFFLHDGEEKSQYSGFESGVHYISASNTTQPTVVGRDGRTPLTKASGLIYAGCYVQIYVQLWTQDNEYGKGVNASLLGVQFVSDGEPLVGGRPLSVDEFDAFEDEEDDSDIPW